MKPILFLFEQKQNIRFKIFHYKMQQSIQKMILNHMHIHEKMNSEKCNIIWNDDIYDNMYRER